MKFGPLARYAWRCQALGALRPRLEAKAKDLYHRGGAKDAEVMSFLPAGAENTSVAASKGYFYCDVRPMSLSPPYHRPALPA